MQVKAGDQQFELLTDSSGVLRLNLLDSPFSEQDIARLNMLQLSVEDRLGDDVARAETTLMVSHTLRGKLREAHDLIFDDLEDGDVDQWVHRVKRLSDLGLEEEASELEQSLIELTRNDPELQEAFLKALLQDAGRLAADPAAN